VRNGGGPGFDDAFDGLAVLAHRVAYRILGSSEDAEEVAQEALARAYARWSKVSAYPEPWVVRVATNLALGRWRKARSGRRHVEPATAVDAADAALRVDLVELLRALPRRQREVVVLRYLADRSEQETADALGCSTGTVKQHAHRGLAALRSSITDAPGGCDVRTT
jgi:RNA polymerase sigma-70 factor (sigma-E family)